jgi:hypothetical protein
MLNHGPKISVKITYRADLGKLNLLICWIFGSSQYSLVSQLPLKTMLNSKVVKIDSKTIISLCSSTSVPHSVLNSAIESSLPLSFLPSATKQPLLDLLHQPGQILGVGLHDLVEFGKLSGSEKDLGQAKLKILVVKS